MIIICIYKTCDIPTHFEISLEFRDKVLVVCGVWCVAHFRGSVNTERKAERAESGEGGRGIGGVTHPCALVSVFLGPAR